MPFIVNGMAGTLWGTGLRKTITGVCGLVVAIGGAVSVIKAEASDAEYIWVAHRGYVRWYTDDRAATEAKKVSDAFEARLKKQELAQNEVARVAQHTRRELLDGKRESAEHDLFNAQLELGRAKDEHEKEYINKEIFRLDNTLKKLNQAVEHLNKTPGSD